MMKNIGYTTTNLSGRKLKCSPEERESLTKLSQEMYQGIREQLAKMRLERLCAPPRSL